MTDRSLRLRVIPAIAEVKAAAWDACANPGRTDGSAAVEATSQEPTYNPFISYDFLDALEASGSATARTGWQPQHLLAETAGRRASRRRALLSEIAFARRIRVRPRLGRGL